MQKGKYAVPTFYFFFTFPFLEAAILEPLVAFVLLPCHQDENQPLGWTSSIFAESLTNAVGGFLGASISFAISRGVNRGLYSNEAGQGSAPIAHASAKTNEPVSEGLVAILEPFIDTIIICTITGLVLLSSGVWNEKHENTFAQADLIFLDKVYTEDKEEDVKDIRFSHWLD